MNDHPVDWLEGLRNVEYKDAHEALLGLQGVGPKVADCVCLMSLDKAEAVPVDTHGLCPSEYWHGQPILKLTFIPGTCFCGWLGNFG